jgi:hypothetical protein
LNNLLDKNPIFCTIKSQFITKGENAMEMKDIIVALPSLEGSFIQELIETMLAGNFVDIKEAVGEDEKIVSEMNDMEKALQSLCENYRETERIIVPYFRGETTENHTPEEEAEMKQHLAICRDHFKIAKQLMWGSIKVRLADLDKKEASGLGIRADFKIVQMFDDCDCDCPACQVKRDGIAVLEGPGFTAIMM